MNRRAVLTNQREEGIPPTHHEKGSHITPDTGLVEYVIRPSQMVYKVFTK